jgi:hypothetical protein
VKSGVPLRGSTTLRLAHWVNDFNALVYDHQLTLQPFYHPCLWRRLKNDKPHPIRRVSLVTMGLFTLYTALTAILHTTSALPYSAPFLSSSFIGLSECAKSCKSLREATIYCLPRNVSVSNNATYIACVCQSQWLRGVKDNSGLCAQECNHEDEGMIRDTYSDMCGIPGPSASVFLSVPAQETSPTSTPVPSTSIVVALTTSTSTITPAFTSTPPVEEPKVHFDHHETRYVHAATCTRLLSLTSSQGS